jgi:hypothetical protein
MLELLYTSHKTISTSGNGPAGLVYVGSWDALLLLNGTRLDKLFRDGSRATMGVVGGFWGPGSRVSARAYWINNYGPGTATIYAADEVTGQYCVSQVLDPAWPVPAGLKGAGNFLDDWAGIYVHNEGPGQVGFYRLTDGALLGRVQLNSTSVFDSLSYVGRNKVLAFQKSTGKIALLDYLNRIILWQSKVRPALACAYDSRHNLVVTVESDHKVRVYLTTPIPATLSAPEFYPAVAQVTRLLGYPVRARLLGDAGEPCPGYWLRWDFVNIPAKGYLQKAMSCTDQNGYAQNYYFGPPLATGQETIRVEVTI